MISQTYPTQITNNVYEPAKEIQEEKKEKILFSRYKIKWVNVFFIFSIHAIAVYTALTYPWIQHYKTTLYIIFSIIFTGFGITGGVHRYWTHKAFKAKLPLKIFLLWCYITAGQNSIYDWVRDHRVHHKFTETDADPHNSKRGFFFSHVGWLLVEKHPNVIEKGRQINMSDIENDKLLNFVNKHFGILKIIAQLITIAIPVYLWNESWCISIASQFIRFIYVLNVTWSVNSFAHIWGTKPYDKKIAPVENKFVTYSTGGEGWHNFHHVFPTDYRCPEFSERFDLTATFIELFEKIGWAYDLKTTNESMVSKVIEKHGDGTLKT